jgi:hypothetical protein
MPIYSRRIAAALAAVAALIALPVPAPAAAAPLQLEIVDRASGVVLNEHTLRSRRYVAGEPGREFELRLRNRTGGRLLAVTSVDGINVVDGRTASPDQAGYVLGPWQSVTIDGWRKSLDEVAAFYFTALQDSYAARTGRPRDVGVIGVAVFRERERAPQLAPAERRESCSDCAGDAAQPSSPSRASAEASMRSDRLGTGHGRRLDSQVEQVDFERASATPDTVLRVFYDSRRNLLARGVIPQPRREARRLPEPFPAGFVPDP